MSSSRTRVVCIKAIWFPVTYTGCNGLDSGLGSNVERGFDGMGILCVFCVYDTIGNRCFEKTSFPKIVNWNVKRIHRQIKHTLTSALVECASFLYIKACDTILYSISFHVRIQRRGRGPKPPSPDKSQNYRVSCNTGPDSLKNYKATKPAFKVGPTLARQWNAI